MCVPEVFSCGGSDALCGPDVPHTVRTNSARTLTEALQTQQRACHGRERRVPVVVQARGEANPLAQTILSYEAAIDVTRHDRVKAVGTEVNRRNDDRSHVQRATASRLDHGDRQTLKEEPQPQVVEAFGSLMTNCAPSRSSR